MIVGLVQLGCFLGTAWCIGYLVERCLGRDEQTGPPPGWTEPTIPPGPPAGPTSVTPSEGLVPAVVTPSRTVLCVPTVGETAAPVIRV